MPKYRWDEVVVGVARGVRGLTAGVWLMVAVLVTALAVVGGLVSSSAQAADVERMVFQQEVLPDAQTGDRRYAIFTASADLFGKLEIVSDARQPSLSPNNEKVVFTDVSDDAKSSWETRGTYIAVVSATGGPARPIWRAPQKW